MSPSEAQLRAALREGEGDGIDAGRVMAGAYAMRAVRRRRVNVALGACAAVAVVGVGFGVLAGLDTGSGRPGGGNLAGRAAASSASGPARGPGGAPARRSTVVSTGGSAHSAPASAAADCPARPYRIVPAGGSPGTPFADRVDVLTVCAYPAAGSVRRATLSGAAARAVVAALGSAAQTPSPRSYNGVRCAQPGPSAPTLVLLAAGPQGRLQPVVVRVADCGSAQLVSRGGVGYLARLPAPLRGLLR